MTLFSWALNDFKLFGHILASRGHKRGQKWNFDKKVRSFNSLSKTAYMILFSWALHDFKLFGHILASRGHKRGQKWNFDKNFLYGMFLGP